MKWVILGLVFLLSVSMVANVFLWGRVQHTENANNVTSAAELTYTSSDAGKDPDDAVLFKENNSPSGKVSVVEKSEEQLTTQTQRTIFKIKQQIAAGEIASARRAIQDLLRAQPQHTDYLLLEAELIKATANVDEVLAHFYTLLDLPLSTEQRADVLLTITRLTNDNIEKLKSIGAWDVLATFLEPLWQFDPNRKSIILSLAESYARQRQEFLMENVLASLSQDDMEASRIRQIFARQSTPTQMVTSAEQPADASQYERSISLASLGDHFIAPLSVGRTRLNLMIDTGASTTVISRDTFRSLPRNSQFEYIGSFKVNTAGGQVTAPLFQIKQVFLGGFRLDDIAVVVLDMPDFTFADGLLGMNLLRQFDFKIDQQNAELLLSRSLR